MWFWDCERGLELKHFVPWLNFGKGRNLWEKKGKSLLKKKTADHVWPQARLVDQLLLEKVRECHFENKDENQEIFSHSESVNFPMWKFINVKVSRCESLNICKCKEMTQIPGCSLLRESNERNFKTRNLIFSTVSLFSGTLRVCVLRNMGGGGRWGIFGLNR